MKKGTCNSKDPELCEIKQGKFDLKIYAKLIGTPEHKNVISKKWDKHNFIWIISEDYRT